MKIEVTQDLEAIKRKNEVYWRFKWKKYLTYFKILSFCSLSMILMCSQHLIFFKEDPLNSSQFDTNTTYVLLAISILSLLFVASHIKNYKKQKKIYFKNVELLTKGNIEINDEFLSFKTETIETNVKWNAIKSFSVVENCLFLSQFRNKENAEFIIDLNQMRVEEKSLLLKFVTDKLTKNITSANSVLL